MTDEEAEKLIPAVEEFVRVVAERDRDGMEACFAFTPAVTLAIMLADLYAQAKVDAVNAEIFKHLLRAHRERGALITKLRDRNTELRSILYGKKEK